MPQRYASGTGHGSIGRVRLLICCGYAYLLGLIAAIAALIGLLGWHLMNGKQVNAQELKLLLLAVVLLFFIVRALWVRIPAPVGRELRREEAPQLFNMIDEVCERLEAPRPRKVMIELTLNAAAIQVPRLGIFGWHYNVLSLGYPLFHAFSAAELKSIIAHEYGHFSGNHAQSSNWIYRVRAAWLSLAEQLQRRGSGDLLFLPFFRWYLPHLESASSALSHTFEFEADRCASELTSPRDAARALVRITLLALRMDDDFWKPFYSGTIDGAPMPQLPLRRYLDAMPALAVGPLETAERERLEDALCSSSISHPAASSRIAAMLRIEDDAAVLKEVERMLHEPPLVATAASELLSAPSQLFEDLERQFQRAVAPRWDELTEYYRAAKSRLAQLEGHAESAEEYAEKGSILELLGREEQALEAYKAAHALDPQEQSVGISLAITSLKLDRSEGVELFRRYSERVHQLLPALCEAAMQYFARKGEVAQMEAAKSRMIEAAEAIYDARRESVTITEQDRYTAASISAADRQQIAAFLKSLGKVRRAYLTAKQPRSELLDPIPVLLILPRLHWGSIYTGGLARDHSQAILDAAHNAAVIPRGAIIIVGSGGYRWLLKRMKADPGARLL